MESKLKEFFSKFFGNLGSKVEENGSCLIISNVSPGFEKFSGKESPYYLCFDSSEEVSGDYEIVNANHYLVKSIKEFLEGYGEMTLLKLETQFDPKEEIPKIIPFRNCEIKTVSKTSKNDFVLRFSFATIFQYLNDREQIMNNIYIRDNQVIDFDESLNLSEGNKRDVKEINTKDEYGLAKNKLKELTNPKIEELKLRLGEQLKKEILRIKSHYENHSGEIVQQKDSLKKQIGELDASDNNYNERKKKLEKMLEKLEDESSQDKFNEEEETLIKDEIRKHGLNIKNKLINVSVIYFPIYNVNFVLNSGNNKVINFEYDSLKKEIAPLFCSNCKEKLNEIIVCSSGHTTCRNCGNKCEVCGGVFCGKCPELTCSFCKRKICSSCAETCILCKKTFCRNHSNTVPGTSNKKLCRNCVQKCSKCFAVVEPSSMRKVSGEIFCMKCYNKEVGKRIIEGVFD